MRLPLGKLPKKILEEKVLKYAITDKSVVLPPRYGEDGSIIFSDDRYIISAADPITGATRDAGWLSVNVNANDIVVHAANPKWFTTIILFPKEISTEQIENTLSGIKEALEQIGANLIGGHTEITDRVRETIISGFMMGTPMVKGKYVTSSGAKDGDLILMTKGAGIEGTYILATEFGEKIGIDEEVLGRVSLFREMLSVIPEVKTLVNEIGIENIHAMHDATEGGLLNAIYEMSVASNKGFIVYRDDVLVREETRQIAQEFKIDPLKLISSGTLIAAIQKDEAPIAVKALKRNGIDAAIIGEFRNKPERILVEPSGESTEVRKDIVDEIWLLLERLKNAKKN